MYCGKRKLMFGYYNGNRVSFLYGNAYCADGHELVEHEEKAPTCTESGWNAYVTCNKCGYSTFKTIPALGHNYINGVCTVCGKEGGGGNDTGDGELAIFDYENLLEVFANELSLSINGIAFTFSQGESTQSTPYNNSNQSLIRYFKWQILRFATNGEAIKEIEILCKGDLTEGDIPLTCETDGQLTMHFDGTYTYIVWVPNADMHNVELIVAINRLEVSSITVTKVATGGEEPTQYNMIR